MTTPLFIGQTDARISYLLALSEEKEKRGDLAGANRGENDALRHFAALNGVKLGPAKEVR